MSSNDRGNLPPLPEEAWSALEALRKERPSARLRHRLHEALREAEASESRPAVRPVPRWRGFLARTHAHHAQARMVLGAALAGVLLVLAVQVEGLDELLGASRVESQFLPSREFSLRLPGEGSGWLELPWSRDVHSGEPATVRLEAPAGVDFHPDAGQRSPLQLVGCESGRCTHQFTADTGASATPLRVRIDKPGRYEFRVSHSSENRQVHEHFVVVADH